MEIVENAGEDTPEDEIRRLNGDCREESEPLTRPPEDRDRGGREKGGLDHEQDPGIVPDPVEGCDRHQDRVKVVTEQVRDHLDGVGDDLQPAVSPDSLVLDPEIKGVAGEMIVPVDADRGIRECRQQREPERHGSHAPLMYGCFHTGRAAFSVRMPMLDRPLSLVIPAHNEAPNMPRVIGASVAALNQLSPDWEVILVDDGSTDDTVALARAAMGAAHSRLRVISHQGKRGYGVTVADGLRAAAMGYVAFMDGDGQFDPVDLTLLAALMPSADLAAASPLLARSALLNTELYFKCRRSGLRIQQIAVSHYPRVAGVRSGARVIPILRAVRDLVWLRLRLALHWRAPSLAAPAPESS